MSKSVRYCVPLMITSKVREPAVEKYVSAKCSLTMCAEFAAKPGTVYVKFPERAY